VNADLAQHGLGSASCGPGVLPQHALCAGPHAFAVAFRALGGHGDGKVAGADISGG